MRADTTSWQHVPAVLKKRIGSGSTQKFATVLEVMDKSLLRKAVTILFCRVVRAPRAVQLYGASDARVIQWFCTLFCEKGSSPLLLSRSPFSPSVVPRRTQLR